VSREPSQPAIATHRSQLTTHIDFNIRFSKFAESAFISVNYLLQAWGDKLSLISTYDFQNLRNLRSSASNISAGVLRR